MIIKLHAMKSKKLFFLMICGVLSSSVFAQDPEIKLDSLQLTSDTLLLEGVSVIAERPLFSVDGEKTVYQVSDDPTVQSGVASDALQNTPGVEVDIEGNITLHGASSWRSARKRRHVPAGRRGRHRPQRAFPLWKPGGLPGDRRQSRGRP